MLVDGPGEVFGRAAPATTDLHYSHFFPFVGGVQNIERRRRESAGCDGCAFNKRTARDLVLHDKIGDFPFISWLPWFD
jgi:hypothetical protein